MIWRSSCSASFVHPLLGELEVQGRLWMRDYEVQRRVRKTILEPKYFKLCLNGHQTFLEFKDSEKIQLNPVKVRDGIQIEAGKLALLQCQLGQPLAAGSG